MSTKAADNAQMTFGGFILFSAEEFEGGQPPSKVRECHTVEVAKHTKEYTRVCVIKRALFF